MPSWRKVIVSGSDAVLSSVTASFQGNLTGTASFASTAPYSGLTGTVPTWNQNTTGNAATATTASFASTAPYSGLTGTIPTWNQNTTGNAATATSASAAITSSFAHKAKLADSASFVLVTYNDQPPQASQYWLTVADTFGTKHTSLLSDSRLSYFTDNGTLYSPSFSGSFTGSISNAVSASFAPNFANTNLSLNNNRTHNLAGNNLTFTATNNESVVFNQSSGGSFEINGSPTIQTSGVIQHSGSGYFTGNIGIGTTATTTARLHVSASTGIIIRATAAGSDILVVSSSGNVGIGTTNPVRDLQIGSLASVSTATPKTLSLGGTYSNSAGNNVKLKVYDTGADIGGMSVSGGQMEVNTWSTGKIAFYRGTTQTMIIDATGSVGIGTATPEQKLQVEGSLLVNSGTSATAFRDIMMGGITGWSTGESHGIDTVYNTAASPTTFSRIESHFDGTNGRIRFRNLFNASNPRTDILMTIQGDGNVGIGTDSPGAKLEVASSGTTFASIKAGGGDNAYLQLVTPSSNIGYIIKNTATSNSALNKSLYLWNGDGPIQFVPNAVIGDAVTIAVGGNVGIGITNPSYKLQVTGTAYINETLFVNGIATIEDRIVSIYDMFIGNSDTELEASTTVAGNINFQGITAQGAGATATTQQGITWQVNNYNGTTNYGIQAQLVVGNNGNVGTFMGLFTSNNYSAPPVERLRIQHNGNVGIGITNPANRLDVLGTVSASAFLGLVTNATSASFATSASYANNAGNAATATTASFATSATSAGSATTATTAATASTFNGLNFNGITTRFTGDLNTLGLSSTSGIYNIGAGYTNGPGANLYGTLFGIWNTDISVQFWATYNGDFYWRKSSGPTYSGGWRTILDTVNYNSYVPALTGTGASGTWAIAISGNAATATSASFASTAPYSGLTGTVTTWNQNTTGNAATATSASFASTAPYSGLTGTVTTWNQNTTGNAATATSASVAITSSFAHKAKLADSASFVLVTYNDQPPQASQYWLTVADTFGTKYTSLLSDSRLSYFTDNGTLYSPVFSGSFSGSISNATSASFAPNFANTNLSLNDNRTHNLAGNNLTFTATSNESVVFNQSSAGTFEINGSPTIQTSGDIQHSGSGYFTGNIGIGTTATTTARLHVSASTGIIIRATAAGSDILVVSSSGNVGIGTDSPNSRLNIVGDAATNGLTVKSAGNGSTFPLRVTWASGTNGDMLNVDDDGRTRLNNAPVPTVGGFTNTTLVVKQKADGLFGGGLHIEEAATTSVAYFGFNGSTFRIGTSYRTTGDYRPISFATNGLERLRIANDGNVGIGVASPNEKLQVGGNINAYINGGIDAGLFASTSAGSTTIALRSNGVTHFNGGNVGIGTTAPIYPLVISNRGPSTGERQLAIGNTATGGTFLFLGTSATTSGYGVIQNISVEGTSYGNLILQPEGAVVGIGATSPSYALDVYNTGASTARVRIVGTSNYSLFQSDNSSGNFYLGIDNSAGSGFSQDAYSRVLFSSGAYPLVISTNSIERMRITSGGNVGIGTTSPGAKLDVNGEVVVSPNTAGKNTFTLTTNASNDGRLLIKSDTTNKVDIQANGITYFTGGNVGIGTTTPGLKLSVVSSTTGQPVLRLQNTDVDGYTGAHLYSSAGTLVGHFGWANGTTNTLSDKMYFGTIANKPVVFTTNDSEKVRITADGNVGIGVTNPATRLQVSDSTATTQLSLTNSGGGGGATLGTDTSGNLFVGAPSNIYFKNFGGTDSTIIGTSGQIILNSSANTTFTGTGNVGIGTTAPGAKLHVDGGNAIFNNGLADTILAIETDAAGLYDPIFQMGSGQNTIASEGFEIWYSNNVGDVHLSTTYNDAAASIRFHTATGASKSTSNERMIITGAGNVGIGTTSPGYKLEVSGNSYFSGLAHFAQTSTTGSAFRWGSFGTAVSPDTMLCMNQLWNGSGWTILDANYGTTAINLGSAAASPTMQFQTGGANTSATTKMIILNNGNVGIGTATPTVKLHISGGGVRIQGSGDPNNSLRFDDTGSTSRNAMFVSSSNYLVVGNTNYAGIQLIHTGSAPGANNIDNGASRYYGTDQTYYLAEPDKWLAVRINSVNYVMPMYQV